MDQARDEPLEQLALAQHDLGLVAGALRQVAGAVGRLAHPNEAHEQPRPAREQEAAHGEREGEGERSDQHRYDERALRSSAVIAGTISVRSPITA